MVQRFVEHDPDEHYFTLLEAHGDDFRRMAAFDIVINNTDRKGGHCLRADADGHVFGIDHGVVVPRAVEGAHGDLGLRRRAAARSASAPICECLLDKLAAATLGPAPRPLLDRFELDALQCAHGALARDGRLPDADDSYHCYPWPMV